MTYYESLEAAAKQNPNLNDVLIQFGSETVSLRSDFGLWLNTSSPLVGKPETESNLVYVPGSDKVLNLTRALDGKVHHKKRTITMEFSMLRPPKQCESIRSQLESILQGQWLKFRFALDPSWIWTGLFDVEVKPEAYKATVTITAICNPYKVSVTAAAGGDWIWDDFNFETDKIYDTPTEVTSL